VSSELLAAVNNNITGFWGVFYCSLIDQYQSKKMGEAGFSEKLVPVCETTRCHIPKERNPLLQLLCVCDMYTSGLSEIWKIRFRPSL
jgi:hypothetical protein